MIWTVLTISLILAAIDWCTDAFKTRLHRRISHRGLPITSLQLNGASEPPQYFEGNMTTVLFVGTGFGCDQHGQNSTKAALRACRNAIEFNSLPGLRNAIPGGKENMILRVRIAVPSPAEVDMSGIRAIFPYGKLLRPEVVEGGMRTSSGIALPELGDTNDDMIIAIAAVSIGY